jgi:hypothetical protein
MEPDSDKKKIETDTHREPANVDDADAKYVDDTLAPLTAFRRSSTHHQTRTSTDEEEHAC